MQRTPVVAGDATDGEHAGTPVIAFLLSGVGDGRTRGSFCPGRRTVARVRVS